MALHEHIIELRFAYDDDETAKSFPRFPGLHDDPPVESIAYLVEYLSGVIRLSSLTDPALRVCEVDVLTVDHRTPPTNQAVSHVNDDYFN